MADERLSDIQAFVAAVETGSFALAARRLRVTRSAVGKSIARLEGHLGTRLLQRTTRHQSLTEHGQTYYERSSRALAELAAGQAAVEEGRREPVGRVRVTAPTVLGRRFVAPVLFRLARQYPRLTLDLALTDRVADFIEDGVDLAVRSGALPDTSGLVARLLGRQIMAVCAAPAYLKAHGRPATLDDLRGHQAVIYARGRPSAPWTFRDEAGALVRLEVPHRIRCDDLEAMVSAAVAGAGLARLPTWLVTEELRTRKLVRVLDEPRPFGFDVHLLWPQTRHLPTRTRVAVDALLAHVPKQLSAPG